MKQGTKFIFVTGGVVSGLGKGIMGASIGLILKSSGFTVEALKMDPYLNVDPGTMSPYEHGEVYVLGDGSETDLDLGHYERFLGTDLSALSTMSAGRIYQTILNKERKGEFLGRTVQMIPHITDFIKSTYGISSSDVKIIEIGGSTGDMEAEVFLESLRQFRLDHPGQVLHVHLGYVPYLNVGGEYKSKPLQNSLRELLRLGIQSDIIAARYEPQDDYHLPENLIEKIALFGNMNSSHVLPCPDLDNIYRVPLQLLEHTKLLSILETFMGQSLDPKLPKFFSDYQTPKQKSVSVALVSKYTKLSDAYLSVIESIKIAATAHGVGSRIDILDADDEMLLKKLDGYDAIIVPGGFGSRGMEGKIRAIEYARVNKKPFLGICLGMQLAMVECARNNAGLRAVSREMDDISPESDYVIDFIPEQLKVEQKGGTMRLGNYTCVLQDGTKISKLFNAPHVVERHRHRLEVQNQFMEKLADHGMIVSGKFIKPGTDDYLVEMIELSEDLHPYFVGTQSHPEFLSRPDAPHPLFAGLIKACL
ncbi:MAG: CTP synthase [Candidatus Pacebacteria bacterium]|nr:CTP synthase [Candidatus Paceibacterota bacterium]